jgi:beta-lactamase regulating signal transducer with metallopeptidase domain
MIREVTNHVWQSTLFAITATLLTLAFRKNRAQVRYWLWLSASFKFLVPFALLMSLGSRVEVRRATVRAAAPAVTTIVEIAQLFSYEPAAAASGLTGMDWTQIAIVLWAIGFCVIVFVRIRSWLRIRAIVRASAPIEIFGFAPSIRVSAARTPLEPGIVGIFHPTLLLPADIVERLSAKQLQAVLAHEMCHVRRRDNLLSAIHMIVEAVFWFHPLVWWIGARLMEEREGACDEEVLRLDSDPEITPRELSACAGVI